MQNPAMLDESTLLGLRDMIEDFPYFVVPRMLYLRNLKNINSYKLENELEKHAPFIPDRMKLYRLLHDSEQAVEEFELLPYDVQVIEKLKAEDEELLDPSSTKEVLSFAYDSYALKTEIESKTKSKGYDLIDRFLDSSGTKTPSETTNVRAIELAEESAVAKDDLITDTLARIYIQQGFFENALDAYEKLSLKFPEKNVYFAAQIEEIKKLMSKE